MPECQSSRVGRDDEEVRKKRVSRETINNLHINNLYRVF